MEAFEFFIPQNIMVGAGTMAKLPECAKKLGGSHAKNENCGQSG